MTVTVTGGGGIKKIIEKDKRYLAVYSSSLREYWFYNYAQGLKDRRKRSRSRSRGREFGKRVITQTGYKVGAGLGKSGLGNVLPGFTVTWGSSDRRGVGLPVDPGLIQFYRTAEDADTWMAKQEAFMIIQVI